MDPPLESYMPFLWVLAFFMPPLMAIPLYLLTRSIAVVAAYAILIVVVMFRPGLLYSDEKKSDVAAGVSFAVKPESLRECDPSTVATLTWDVRAAGVQGVKIFAVEGKNAAPKLFTNSGASGTTETGPWVHAGHAFILKDEGETK